MIKNMHPPEERFISLSLYRIAFQGRLFILHNSGISLDINTMPNIYYAYGIINGKFLPYNYDIKKSFNCTI